MLGIRWELANPSPAPPANSFSYAFDHLAEIIEQFTDEIGLTRHSLAVQDYGGPVGMRLALRRPERLSALIVQNAVCHEGGLGPLWETRRAFWSDRARHEEALPSFCARRSPRPRRRPHRQLPR